MVPSKFQQAIYAHVDAQKIGELADGSVRIDQQQQAHAIVEAVAGSGKTTTLVKALEQTKHSAIFLAFNKSIAEELKRRVPRHVQARTFHSLCYKPVLTAVGARDVNSAKLLQIAKLEIPMTELGMYGAFARKLVGLARSDGLGCLKPATEEAFMALVEQHDLTLEHEAATIEKGVKWAQKLLEASNESRDVDFDDLLYFAVLKGIALPKFRWVFVDEAQDTNAIQRAILKKILAEGGRLVAVGDPAQAIYGFRGADSNALDLIAEEFSPCLRLPLSVTYRCPTSVVALAKAYVPAIEAREGAPVGLVERLEEKWKLTDLGSADLVVCRTTKPLIDLGYRLMLAKIPVRILGKDLGEGLIALIKRCDGGKGLNEFLAALERWEVRESEKAFAKGNEALAEAIHDKAGALQVLAGALPEESRSTEGLCEVIRKLFTDQNSRVTLSTIHKAKGLERETVWWLNSSQQPSRWAKKPWQQAQEKNLMYVAITRAIERLVLIELPKLSMDRLDKLRELLP